MKLAKKRTMNLRIFDAAAGGEGASTGAEGAGTMGDTTTTDTNTQVSTPGEDNQNSGNQVAADNTSNAVKSVNERKAEFNKRILGEDKEFFDAKVNSIIGKRFKEYKTMESSYNAVQPLLSAIAEDFGLDSSADAQAIIDAYLNSEQRVIDRATKNGISPQQQKMFDKMQQGINELNSQKQSQSRETEQRNIIDRWNSEAQEIVDGIDSEFDLDTAFQNEDFFNLVVNQNVPIKAAYISTNMERYNSLIASKAEKRVTDNIKARGQRPAENGSSQATATTSVDVSNLSDEELEKYAQRALRGEVIDFKNHY